jgi:hypothetical protein
MPGISIELPNRKFKVQRVRAAAWFARG